MAIGEDVSERVVNRPGGEDGLCFTAGYEGGLCGLGATHAYLTSDRKPPLVAAGVSYGAYCAAAIQIAYRDLESETSESEVESARWRAFRRFLWGLVNKPFDSIWRSMPDQSDFFANFATLPDPATPDHRKESEAEAIKRRDRMVDAGRWISQLSIKLSSFIQVIVSYVLLKEGWFGVNKTSRLRRAQLTGLFLARLFSVAELLVWDTARRPFGTAIWRAHRKNRPLFGWWIWSSSMFLVITNLAVIATVFWWLWNPSRTFFVGMSVTVMIALLSRLLFMVLVLVFKDRLVEEVFRALETKGGLIHDFHLLSRVERLFESERASRDSESKSPVLEDEPFPIILVAAALDTLRTPEKAVATDQLLYANPGASLVDSLVAALRPEVIFDPQTIPDSQVHHWTRTKNTDFGGIRLVSGGSLRENPLPGLFKFLRSEHFDQGRAEGARSIVERLNEAEKIDSKRPSIHVIFQVPLEPEDRRSAEPAARQGEQEHHASNNIVDIGALGLRLARRRDTEVSVRATNFISQLEVACRDAAPDLSRADRILPPVQVGSIAPESELTFENRLAPTNEEALRHVASACRRTMEKLYDREISEMIREERSSGEVWCRELIKKISPRRRFLKDEELENKPGLPEVCSQCTRRLKSTRRSGKSCVEAAETSSIPRPGREEAPNAKAAERLLAEFPSLAGQDPRIVILLSGGVFRGAFHVGMVAALSRSGIKPDLIAGSSVGTLLGGCLGALTCLVEENGKYSALLNELVTSFVRVDRKVALTRRLIGAARQLATRGAKIDVTPKQVRQLVLSGTRENPGYAASGAPPTLIDALSNLFLIPHRETREIISQFLAGRHAKAFNIFWKAIKGDTLRRLYIERSLLGASLLRQVAKDLLSGRGAFHLRQLQPYSEGRIAFLATATNLEKERLEILGTSGAFPCDSFDFLQAALASSAFPMAFSPIRQSSIFPGFGNTRLRYADGGMFDNLPFLPALRTLSLCQEESIKQGQCHPFDRLAKSAECPDLFIVGALDVDPESTQGELVQHPTPIEVYQRLEALRANSKIRSFQNSSTIVDRQIENLIEGADDMEPTAKKAWVEKHAKILGRTVNAAVLPIFPSDREHLNGTFSFCAAAGLERVKIRKSIADGCFQTFRSLILDPKGRDRNVRSRSLRGLREKQRIPEVEMVSDGPLKGESRICPYFRVSKLSQPMDPEREGATPQPFVCPFSDGDEPESSEVFAACVADKTHRETVARGVGNEPDKADLDAMGTVS